MTAFTAGQDSRRNTRGRPPSSKTLSALIRSTIGRDAPAIFERVRVLAQAGDPQAVAAAATLLAATVEASK